MEQIPIQYLSAAILLTGVVQIVIMAINLFYTIKRRKR